MRDQREETSPGRFLREAIENKGWTQSDLAYVLGITAASVSQILSDKRSVSNNMAIALGAALELDARVIARIQADFDLTLADAADPSILMRAKILSKYPLRDMVKRGWVNPEKEGRSLEAQICRFFGVSKMDDIPHLALSGVKVDFDSVPPDQLAWLFRVNSIATKMVIPSYNKGKLQEAVSEFYHLLSKPDGVRHVPKLLARAGVRFVVVECLPKLPIDGACFWLDQDAPVIGMSIRQDRIDNFWFALRHECAHVLHGHGKSKPIMDCNLGDDDPALTFSEEERVANLEAAEFCKPLGRTAFYPNEEPSFSESEAGISERDVDCQSGLVAGRLPRRFIQNDSVRKQSIKVRYVLSICMAMDGWGNVIPVDH